jgi:hypothetical protein
MPELSIVPFTGEGPQPLLRAIPPGAVYPVAALGPLTEAVQAVQGATLAPVAIPAQSALAVVSLAVMGHADVETLGGWSPPALYALTIAQSGERKSTCDAMLMAALRAHEAEQAAAQRDDLTRWQNAYALWKGDRDKILGEAKAAKGIKRTEAEADLAALGAEPIRPPVAGLTVTEPTFEGLTRHLAEGLPVAGIFSDEGGQFLGGHGMNSDNRQKTVTALNDLWGGNAIRRTRAGEGSSILFGRRLALHLMVQPEIARAFLADRLAGGSGFTARLLVTEPPSTIGTRLSVATRAPGPALDQFAARLRAILAAPLPMDDQTRALTPRRLPLSSGARAALVDFADGIEADQAPGGALAHVTGFASKAAEHAARLAAVLTLWPDLSAREVTPSAMASGIALARFYLGEAVRLLDATTVTPETARAEALRVWLLDTWPGRAERLGRSPGAVTPKDVVQHGPNALRETAMARRLMEVLAGHGWLERLVEGAIVDGAARKLAYRIVKG